ncbi:MAG: Ppx/GppA family phosphatase, partial [Firmicutes bacterium]|nr:Ppx/GppA family phosphatase [Bacillota bacterium]
MTRLAAIDIGTNSTRLLVAEVAGGRVKVVETGLCTTRLGEGINEGILHAGAMERTLAAVAGFAEAAQKLGARQVVAAATSAVRDAANRADFLAMVKERAGLE